MKEHVLSASLKGRKENKNICSQGMNNVLTIRTVMTNKSDLRIKFAYSETEYNATLFLFKVGEGGNNTTAKCCNEGDSQAPKNVSMGHTRVTLSCQIK